jgi:TetR/AcrR family transcriptional regulator, tetracycline repressor protein
MVYRRTMFTSSTMLAMPDRVSGAAPEPPWRSKPRRQGVPRPRLSREVVVAAALEVLERGDALTMRRVADQIGVSASSLYGYVDNKDELVNLVLDRIFAEVDVPPTGSWQETLRQFGRAMLAMYRRHRGVALLTLGRVGVTPSMFPMAERILSELRSAGMPDQVAAFAGDLAGRYVGALACELDAMPMAGQEQEFLAQFTSWIKSLPADRFPNTVALADVSVAGTAAERFDWGLDVLIRGLGSYLKDPPDPAAGWPSGP